MLRLSRILDNWFSQPRNRKNLRSVRPAKRRRFDAEPLEPRCLLTAAIISNAELNVTVDPYGAYGSATNAGDAFFRPPGISSAGTTFQSGLFFSPANDFLTESNFATTPQPSGTFSSQTNDTVISEFDVANFHVLLTQSVGEVRPDGSTLLTQQYIFTNNTGSSQNFSVVRHVDGDLFFQGNFQNDFAGVSQDGRFVFEFDTASDPAAATAFFGITSSGDGAPAGFTVQPFPFIDDIEGAGGIPAGLLNLLSGDANNDRLTDAGYDVTVSLADSFSLAAGASATYTSTTVFGQGSPVNVISPGSLQLSGDTSVDENAGTATITVNRVGGFAGTVSVDYSTSPGTATEGVDYTGVSGTLVFADGQLTSSFTVPILDDSIFEGDETVNVLLSNPTGGAALSAPTSATLTIRDNESLVQFSSPTFSAHENAGIATITVERLGGSAATSVDFTTADGTATAGVDYLGASGTLNFASGETTKTITITILSDTIVEGDETVALALSNPANGTTIGTNGSATLTIDEAPTISHIQTVASKSKISAIVLTFSEPVDGSQAETLAAYSLATRGKDGRFNTGTAKSVKLRRAAFDGTNNTVTIVPKKKLDANIIYELTLKSGLSTSDRTFNRIDGDADGTPGGDLRVFVARGTKINYIERAGDEVRLRLRGGGDMELIRGIDGEGQNLSLFNTAAGVSVLSGTVNVIHPGGNGITTLESIAGLTGVDNELDPNVFVVVPQS